MIIHQTLKLISMQLKRLQIFAKGLILVLFMFQQIMSLMAKKDNEYDELDIPKPINKYGKAKLEGENYIRSNLNNFYIIRTSWLYSEFEKDTNFLHKIIESITSGNTIFGAEDIYGSPTYSGDLAHAIMLLVNKDLKCTGETFHFCNNGYVF